MAMDPHPSVKPSKPRKPPEASQAHFEHNEPSKTHQKYGASFTTHEHSTHKSEFEGVGGGFRKAGDKD